MVVVVVRPIAARCAAPAAADTSNEATQVTIAARSLSELAETLRAATDRFLAAVRSS